LKQWLFIFKKNGYENWLFINRQNLIFSSVRKLQIGYL